MSLKAFTVNVILISPMIFSMGNFSYSQEYASQRVRSKEILSETYVVDKIYKSMKGPQSTEEVFLMERDNDELVWVTGYNAVMVGADGLKPALQEFMCHSNLDFNVQMNNQKFGRGNYVNPRLFTLSQGQFSIRLPEGFGIPMLGNTPLNLTTQVLNHNFEDESFQVRHKVTIHFVRDQDLKTSLKPLYPSSAYGLAVLNSEEGYYGVDDIDKDIHGPGCLVGANATTHTYPDQFGRIFTGHWVVKPGQEVNRTLVTKIMKLSSLKLVFK